MHAPHPPLTLPTPPPLPLTDTPTCDVSCPSFLLFLPFFFISHRCFLLAFLYAFCFSPACSVVKTPRPLPPSPLQLGGSTRDLFYYPEGTLQVTVGGPQVGAMWEQAGVQAKVPVVAVTADVQASGRASGS